MTSPFFDVLGVRPDATDEELRMAFRREALRWHPDKNPTRVHEATERFKLIARAYAALREKRMESSCNTASCPSYGSRNGCSSNRQRSKSSSFVDPRFGFCNQCAGRPDMRCSGCGSSDFSMDAATDFFREVFGEDIRDVLGKLRETALNVAAIVVSQAEVVAKHFVVSGNAPDRQANVISGRSFWSCCRRQKRKSD
eukprot:TRINITY_DN52898_c0_g1_i1.p1 TRINITY_DN52898_c0_g1~~TRINITY_DN52898_c0_g1_i1.p1  ORF type:complete len:197 (+),score=16.84 TRINITY_DN52898_c0_g1_i1:63-653(+)